MTELFLTVASLAAFVLALVGLAKDRLRGTDRLKGWTTILLSLGLGVVLGALLASGGIRELRVLELYPPAASGAFLGLLAGLLASGGKAVVTGVQINGAAARARADAQYNPAPAAPGAAPDDGWVDSDLSSMTRTDWPPVDLAPQRTPGGTP